jgi:hypothetical protein
VVVNGSSATPPFHLSSSSEDQRNSSPFIFAGASSMSPICEPVIAAEQATYRILGHAEFFGELDLGPAADAHRFADGQFCGPQAVSNVGLLTFRRHYCAKILSVICFAL